MGQVTSIGWTDHTFNAWWGCSEVSPGCDNCYAREFDKRVFPVTIGGVLEEPEIAAKHWLGEYRTFGEKHWNELLKWDAQAAKAGRKARVFFSSMCDVLDARAPEAERQKLWEYCRRTPNLIKQFLTKRPQNYERLMPFDIMHDPNSWKGFTAENQEWFDLRWKHVFKLPGIRFVSYEPALGPLSVTRSTIISEKTRQIFPSAMSVYPDWIICGGESGNQRRPFAQRWADDLLRECQELNIAFFMKQMGARTPDMGKALIPAHLQVWQFPHESRA